MYYIPNLSYSFFISHHHQQSFYSQTFLSEKKDKIQPNCYHTGKKIQLNLTTYSTIIKTQQTLYKIYKYII